MPGSAYFLISHFGACFSTLHYFGAYLYFFTSRRKGLGMILFESVTTSLLEVPNRVSLIFNLSKCPLRCKGCHSPELRQAIGEPLTVEVFQKYLQKYDGLVNCICFMGGDLRGDEDHFVQLLEVCQEKNIEVCIYTGLTEVFVPAKI